MRGLRCQGFFNPSLKDYNIQIQVRSIELSSTVCLYFKFFFFLPIHKTTRLKLRWRKTFFYSFKFKLHEWMSCFYYDKDDLTPELMQCSFWIKTAFRWSISDNTQVWQCQRTMRHFSVRSKHFSCCIFSPGLTTSTLRDRLDSRPQVAG